MKIKTLRSVYCDSESEKKKGPLYASRVGLYSTIVHAVPHEDYPVTVYFCDGKSATYEARQRLEQGVFQVIKENRSSCVYILS